MTTLAERIDEMGTRLAASGIDLADERAAMRVLTQAGYGAGDILVLLDDAISRARIFKRREGRSRA